MSREKSFRREFDTLDQGKTGKISTKDFRRLVFENESLQGFRNETIDAYIDELSENTGWINFEQFTKFMEADTKTSRNPLVITELKLAFKEVDTNQDGFISSREAQHGITLAGEHIPGFSFNQILHKFDDNGDGQMSLQEFLNNIEQILPSISED